MEIYGIPYKMVFNGSMEEIYIDDGNDIDEVDVNDVERGE